MFVARVGHYCYCSNGKLIVILPSRGLVDLMHCT